MKVAKVAEMKELDNRATAEFGISQELLMENAGQAVYSVVSQEIGVRGNRFVVLCGGGNNGGDGLVVARKIRSSGGEVKVFLLDDESRFRGAARKNLDIVSKMAIEIARVSSLDSVTPEVFGADGIVDAVFGTGLVRKIDGLFRDVIDLVNQSPGPVFAVDIPSGINGDTGEVMGTAVRADFTVTFGLPKRGCLLYPGYDYCGKVYVSHISFPPVLYESDAIGVAINAPLELPVRVRDTHKGSYGKTLSIAGSPRYVGAPYFSALSFLKAGGGLSYLAAPSSIASFVAGKGGEVVVLPQRETSSGSIALSNKYDLVEFSRMVDMVIIGPGLSLDDEAQELIRELVKVIDRPLLIDGDGITAIAQDLASIRERRAATILTPHHGEMSRITTRDVKEAGSHKIDTLQNTARDLNAVVVLKGAHSLIGYPDGTVFINLSGNPGMATAGSGDVLTGSIAAMFGLGLSLEDAVRMGVFIHGLAGDIAAVDRGEDGMTAQDILDSLPEAMKLYRQNFAEISENLYESIYVV